MEIIKYDYDGFGEYYKKNKLPFGVSDNGDIVTFNPTDTPFLLISGYTKRGKTTTAKLFVYEAVMAGYNVFVSDQCKVCTNYDFAKDNPNVSILGNLKTVLEKIEYISDQITIRMDLLKEYNVGSYEKLPDDVKPKRLMLIVDEFFNLCDGDTAAQNQVVSIIKDLAKHAKTLGISVIITSQAFGQIQNYTILSDPLIRESACRLLFGDTTQTTRKFFLKDPDNCPTIQQYRVRGRGVYEPISSPAITIKAYYSGDDDELKAQLEKGVK